MFLQLPFFIHILKTELIPVYKREIMNVPFVFFTLFLKACKGFSSQQMLQIYKNCFIAIIEQLGFYIVYD